MNEPICYDKNGNAITVGSTVMDDNGHVWTVNGFSYVPKSGVYAFYSNQVLAVKGPGPTPLVGESDTIIWGS